MRLIQERLDKSTMERILIEAPVHCTCASGAAFKGSTIDLSVGGIYLKSRYNLEHGDLLTVEFAMPFSNPELIIACSVRTAWVNDAGCRLKVDYPPGAGLEFLDLPAVIAARLADFIESYDELKKMNMICAWCGKSLGQRRGPQGKTSHGICAACKERYF